MTKIAGYARQREAKWPYVILITLVLLACVAVLLSFVPQENQKTPAKAKTAATTSTTVATVAAVTTTTAAVTATTQRPAAGAVTIEEISLKKEEGMMYCYTTVSSPTVPRVIRHVWIDPAGETVAEINLTISRSPQDTYSYISLYGAKHGNWEVQVRTDKDEVVTRKNFVID